MTFAALLPLILKYGLTILDLTPQVLAVVAKIEENIAAGRANQTVTPADLAELKRLAGLTAEQIFAAAGVVPPPRA